MTKNEFGSILETEEMNKKENRGKKISKSIYLNSDCDSYVYLTSEKVLFRNLYKIVFKDGLYTDIICKTFNRKKILKIFKYIIDIADGVL